MSKNENKVQTTYKYNHSSSQVQNVAIKTQSRSRNKRNNLSLCRGSVKETNVINCDDLLTSSF